jgi:UDP-galactopyranose mutase
MHAPGCENPVSSNDLPYLFVTSPLQIGLAGAGLSCAVIARTLAEQGHHCLVFESRSHVAGNCHTQRDATTGVLVHTYGPHIFHTDDDEVWGLVNRFMRFMPFVHRVKATVQGRVYALPINLHTINQFFGTTFSPSEARAFIEAQADASITEPRSFEEQALRFIGRPLYEAFFRGYTLKQWEVDPQQLPAAILKRLPVRFNYNDNYFAHRHQGMPEHGYTEMVQRMLDHPLIQVRLNHPLAPAQVAEFDHVFWSGPLDGFFGCEQGRLPYRTLDFERFEADGDFQGCAVMNYGDGSVRHTRITEHQHFAPWEQHQRSVCYREFSRSCQPGDIPYYPVHLTAADALLQHYQARAAAQDRVTFVGRLATYRYMDMDVTLRAALDAAQDFLARSSRPGHSVGG